MCSLAVKVSEPSALQIQSNVIPSTAANNKPLNGSTAAGMKPREAAQYWYLRALLALKQRIADPHQIIREYQHVAALDECIQHTADAATAAAAQGYNRYCNVLPYDHNRVVLQGDQQYINASTITLQLPTVPRPCSYIATQGPLPNTTHDFWRMVYDLKAPAIVMLTNVSECGINKCEQYYPVLENGKARLPGFSLKVEHVMAFSPDCSLRVMQLCSLSTGDVHMLTHYHFHAWPDHGTPDSSAGIRALCRALSPARESGKPIVVHCSAGIGRTGTFCAIDTLLQRLDSWQVCADGSGPDRAEVEAALNMPNLVHELRRQRMGMVQTLEQYAFIYKAIVDDLTARTARASQQQQQQQQEDAEQEVC